MRFFWITAIFVVAFVATLIAKLPLAFVLNVVGAKSDGFQYDKAYGTVWSGALSEVKVSGEDVGLVQLKFRPASLMQVKPEYDLRFSGPITEAQGKLRLSLAGGISLHTFLAEIKLNKVRHLDERLRRSDSSLFVSIDTLKSDTNGRCVEAQGNFESDLLTNVGEVWGWDGPRLFGEVSCQDQKYAFQLQNQGGESSFNANAVLSHSGEYHVMAVVETQEQALFRVLPALGFSTGAPGRYTYSKQQQAPNL